MDKEYYIRLIDKFLQGLTTEEENILLESWIKNPESEKICAQFYKDNWDSVSCIMDSELQYKILDRILNEIEISKPITEQSSSVYFWQKPVFRYMATACMLIVISVTSFYLGINKEKSYIDQLSPISMSVENGQKAEIILPDGTIAYLNSGSRLSYDHAYGKKNRIITLDGEAYFDVVSNKEKPFIVNANELNVVALGTSFNVKSYTSDQNVVVTLIEGVVKVNDKHSEVLMEVNDRLEYNKYDNKFAISKKMPNSDNLLWRSKEFAFYDETFDAICDILSRLYDVKFVFEDEKAKKQTFTGVIKNNSLHNVLDLVSLTSSVDYHMESDNVIVIRSKKNIQ